MIFHIHQERTDALDLNSIAKEFAANSDHFKLINKFYLDHIKFYLNAIMNFISIKIKSFSVFYR